jgi:hypothetical protein
MPTSASILKAVRLTHLYLGVFVAPAVLFFAFTGAIQTFSLHEPGKGGPYKPAANYVPPRWAVVLGQIHKNQTPVVAPPKPKASAAPKAEAAKTDAPKSDAPKADAPKPALPQHNPMPLKYFFALVAWSLFFSTFTGIYMAYKYNRNKIAVTTLLILGTVIPVLMIVL